MRPAPQRAALHRRSLLSATVGTGLSQLGSSASNLLLILAVSRNGDAGAVGEIAVALAGYQLAMGATRSLVGEVVLVRRELLGALDDASAIAASIVVGSAAGAVLTLAGIAVGLDAVWVLGVALPLLAAQDTSRYVSFTTGDSWRAASSDLLWAAAAAAMAFGGASPGLDARTAALWWSVAGSLAIIVFAPWRHLTGALHPLQWVRRSWSISRAYLPDFAIISTSSILPTFFVAAVGGLGEVGGLRLALAFFGPVTIAWAALVNSTTPELARLRSAGVRAEVNLGVIGVTALSCWGVVGYAVPDSTGTAIAGQGWASASLWLPWLTLGLLPIGAGGSAVLGLRARGHGLAAMKGRLAAAPLGLTLPSVGYLWFGRAGYGLGAAAAGTLLTVVMWSVLLTVARGTGQP